MGASSIGTITLPIQATITGYETGLNKMKQAIKNINLGSELGKQINTALSQAEAALKRLRPEYQVFNDAGIDKVFRDVEQTGNAILHVGDLMQQLQLPNLDFSAMGGEIRQIVLEAANLKNSFNVSMNDGIRDAVSQSKELSEIFQSLGVNVTTMTKDQGTEALAKGLAAAGKEAKAAKEAYDSITESIDKLNAKQAELQASPISSKMGRDELIGAVKGIDLRGFNVQAIGEQLRSNFNSIFSMVYQGKQDHHKNGLQSWFDSQLEELTKSMDGGNAKAKLDAFVQQFNDQLNNYVFKGGAQKRPDLGQIFNVDEMIARAFQITPESLNNAADQLKTLVGDILPQRLRGTFETLTTNMENGSVDESAYLQFLKALEKAIRDEGIKVEEALKETKEKWDQKQNELKAASQRVTEAEAKTTQLSGAQTDYNQMINQLEARLAALKAELDKLEARLKEKGNQALTGIKLQGQSGADDVNKAWNKAAGSVKMYRDAVEQAHAKEQFVGRLEGVVQRWFSVYAVVRMITNGIRKMANTIKELDKTITNISIVTNMSSGDLWGQMDKYTETARKFATTISGVYEVAQLYYQQGLDSAQVTEMTEATLKMARIAGMGYSDATNYMTNAVRSFKMEMADAGRVTDVYSAISATSATSTSELAEAMSKTASSAEAVGSSFENTTAMMAVMIEATREAPQNIGSAMKSIISRYGEMTSDPTATQDSEGEEMSLNRVDKALQTVGISVHDATGQFRDFDEVIMELAEKWDTIDKNTQRYISTIMAGNRQQSRFLALVSSYERLKELSETAADSEDASQLQYLKTLDSIDAKQTQLKTGLQSFYTSSGFEQIYKDMLDGLNKVVETFSHLPKIAKLPIPALGKLAVEFLSLAKVVGTGFGLVKQYFRMTAQAITADASTNAQQIVAIQQAKIAQINALEQSGAISQENAEKAKLAIVQESQAAQTAAVQAGVNERRSLEMGATTGTATGSTGGWRSNAAFVRGSRANAMIGMASSMVGLGLSMWANTLDDYKDRDLKAGLSIGGGLLQGVGMGAAFGLPGMLIGGAIGGLAGLAEAIGILNETAEETAERLKKNAEELSNQAIKDKDNYRTLNNQLKKVRELEQTRHNSEEDAAAYQEAIEELVSKFPELSAGMDASGNAIANLTNAEDMLAKARQKSASSAYEAAKAQALATEAELKATKINKNGWYNSYNVSSSYSKTADLNENRGKVLTSLFPMDANKKWEPQGANAMSAIGYYLAENQVYKFRSERDLSIKPTGLPTGSDLQALDDWLDWYNSNKNLLDQTTQKRFNELQSYKDIPGKRSGALNGVSLDSWFISFYKDLNRGALKWAASSTNVPDEEIDISSEYQEFLNKKDYSDQFKEILKLYKGQSYETEEGASELYHAVKGYAETATNITTDEQELIDLILGNRELTDFEKAQREMELAAADMDTHVTGSREWLQAYQRFMSNYQTMTSYVNNPNNQLTEDQQNYYTSAQKWITEDNKDIFPKVEDLLANQKKYRKEILSGQQEEFISELNKSTLALGNYYEESAGSIAIVNKKMDSILGEDVEYSEWTDESLQASRDFVQKYNQWFSSLSLTSRDRLNEMLADTSNYTAEDIINELHIPEGEVAQAIRDYYQDGINSITGRLNKQFEKRKFGSFITDETGKVTSIKYDNNNGNVQHFMAVSAQAKTVVEEQFLQSIIDDYDHLIDSGYMDEADSLLGYAADLFEAIQSVGNPDDRKAINKIISEGDLSTISGIFDISYNLKQAGLIKDSGSIDDALNNLYNTVIVNLINELEQFGYTISKKVENFDKAISNATKGMSLDEAIKMASQLEISLSDMEFKDGKFFLKNFDLLREYYIEYFNEENRKLEDAKNKRIETLSRDNFAKDYKSFSSYTTDRLRILEDHAPEEALSAYTDIIQAQEQWTNFWESRDITNDLSAVFDNDTFKQLLAENDLSESEVKAAYKEFIKSGNESKQSFLDWYIEYTGKEFNSLSTTTREYFEWAIASSYISEGNIQGFIDELIKNEKLTEEDARDLDQKIINAIEGKGSWKDLPESVQQYASLWIKSFQDTGKKINSTISGAIGSTTNIKPENELDKKVLEKLVTENGPKKWIKQLADGSCEIILNTTEAITEYISDLENNAFGLSYEDWLSSLKTDYEKAASKTIYGTAQNVSGKETVDVEAMGNFLKAVNNVDYSGNVKRMQAAAKAYGYAWNEVTKQFELDYSLVNEAATNWRALAIKATTASERSYYLNQANLVESGKLVNQRNALSDILKNWNSVSADQVNKFVKEFGLSLFDQYKIFGDIQADGSYKVNLDALYRSDLVKGYQDVLDENINSMVDNYISNVTSAAEYIAKGTTKFSDITNFSQSYKQIVGKELGSQAFKFDDTLKSFVLNDINIFKEYIGKYRATLLATGQFKNQTEVDRYLTQQILTEFVDIGSLTNLVGGNGTQQERKKLENSFKNLQDLGFLSIEGFDDPIEELLTIIEDGGQGAVDAINMFATAIGEPLSDDQIKSILETYTNNITNTMEQITSFDQGNFIGRNSKINSLLGQAGYTIENGYITGVGDVIRAQELLYEELKKQNDTTLATLNTAYAKILAQKDLSQTTAIEALQNGASMTYEALGTMLTNMGMSLEAVMRNLETFGLKSLGAGKVRIVDWATFSKRLDLDIDSEEYTSAFHTYVDSMINLNRETE